MKVYPYKEVEVLVKSEVVSSAKQIWTVKSKEYFDQHGDRGSCIVSDGIYILYKPKRCRNPQKLMLIPSREVAFCQGSLHYEYYKDEVVAFLQENNIDCSYDYGRMD